VELVVDDVVVVKRVVEELEEVEVVNLVVDEDDVVVVNWVVDELEVGVVVEEGIVELVEVVVEG
jgi:hypothetical protein